MDIDRSVSAAKVPQAARRDESTRLRELDSALLAGSRAALARSRVLLQRTWLVTPALAATPVTSPPAAIVPPALTPPAFAESKPVLMNRVAPGELAQGPTAPPERPRCTSDSLQPVLSATEEITLRRIAHNSLTKLQPPTLERLQQLKLIQVYKGAYALTPLGQHRFERLSKPAKLATDSQLNGLLRILDSVWQTDRKK